MQAILSGAKVYDPATRQDGRTRDQVGAGQPPPPARRGRAGSSRRARDFRPHRGEHAYANAYDLGTIELDEPLRRLRSLRRAGEAAPRSPSAARPAARQRAEGRPARTSSRTSKRSASAPTRRATTQPRADGGDAARDAAVDRRRPRSAGPWLRTSALDGGRRAGRTLAPMYDAGEHVLAGGRPVQDALRRGREPRRAVLLRRAASRWATSTSRPTR